MVTVKSALWNRRIDTPGSIFDLAGRRAAAGRGAPSSGAEPAASVPLKFDVQLLMPSTLRVENNLARMVASADLTLRGTYDRPVIAGHADIERGEVTFEGRRYRITRGTMDFTNPTRIEPFFDVEAETNVRVPGQTYRVTVGFAGTSEQLRPTLNSDPPLPTSDVLALLFSDVRRTGTRTSRPSCARCRTRTRRRPTSSPTRATQAIAGGLSSEVGKVVEQTFGVDTFQLTPSFIDPYSQQTVAPEPDGAADDRQAHLRARLPDVLAQPGHDDQRSDRAARDTTRAIELSWILSRNEDRRPTRSSSA